MISTENDLRKQKKCLPGLGGNREARGPSLNPARTYSSDNLANWEVMGNSRADLGEVLGRSVMDLWLLSGWSDNKGERGTEGFDTVTDCCCWINDVDGRVKLRDVPVDGRVKLEDVPALREWRVPETS